MTVTEVTEVTGGGARGRGGHGDNVLSPNSGPPRTRLFFKIKMFFPHGAILQHINMSNELLISIFLFNRTSGINLEDLEWIGDWRFNHKGD